MEGITFSRLIYSKGNGFQRVEIDEKEKEGLLEQLSALHKEQMMLCILDAMEMCREQVPGMASTSDLVRIACAFFEKRVPASYAVYQEFLARKVHEIKNGHNAKEK